MDRSSPSRDNEISNVMEVTDRSGKVGFVAIGRRPPPPPSTPPAAVIHRSSNQQISTMTTNLNNSTTNNEHITPHPTTTPHVRNSSNQHHMRLSVSGRLNEGYEADHIPTSTTPSPHIDSLQHNITPSSGHHITPSSGHPHITPSSGGHHHRTASRGNSPPQQQQLNRISSTTSVVETLSQQQINRTSVVESQQQITTTNLIVCRICGQHHRSSENHEYNYVKEADEDLQCDICLQPFIKPFDTKCSHTFCELCLKNHIKLKKSCPVDRLELSLSSSDCWESSQVLMKLVNKLQVSCPNHKSCQIIINRGDLQLHLQEKCPGTILRCDKSVFGCTYRGERKYMKDHLQICPYQHMKPKTMEELHPGYRRHIIEIYRKDIYENIGIFIVGGYDTSLKYIIIQAIIQDSIVNKDGRIQPGDIITQVNNEDMSHVDHVEARVILSQLTTKLIRFTIMRYDDELYQQLYQPYIYHVTLLKPPSTQLGIKITAREDEDGIFILEMLEGKVASLSGELKVGDRILMISGVDMTSSTPECAAIVITESEEKVNFVISRRQIVDQQQQQQQNTATIRHNNNTTTRQHESRSNQINRNKSIVRRPAPPPPLSPTSTNRSPTSVRSLSTMMNIPPTTSMNTTQQPSYIFKEIRVLKRLQENLGIVVAGGVDADSGRNLPIFIRDILTNGIMDIDGRLKKGDILINVNNNSLVKLTHSQAVNLLKDVAHNCKEAVFIACQLEYPHKSADFSIWDENLSCHHRMTSSSSTSSSCPSWRMWLSLPVKFHTKREIHLKLSHNHHGGGGDVGIRVAKHDHLCIIKHVVRGSIASRHPANIECGDVILEINGCKTHKMSLTSIQRMMTSLPHQIYVIMQLPGSLH